jgi:hypothetical protein
MKIDFLNKLFMFLLVCSYHTKFKKGNASTLALGLATKARGYKVAGQAGSPGVQENVKEYTLTHPQGNSHFGSWNLGGLPNL